MAQTNVSVAAGGWRIWRLPASGTELFLGFQGVERSNHGAMRLASCTAWSVGFGLKSRSGKFMRDYPCFADLDGGCASIRARQAMVDAEEAAGSVYLSRLGLHDIACHRYNPINSC
jgi:hypothetical protein